MAKSPAEVQKAFRDRKRQLPLMTRLGYPELADEFKNRISSLASDIGDAHVKASRINQAMQVLVSEQPESDKRTAALAELLKTKNVKLPVT